MYWVYSSPCLGLCTCFLCWNCCFLSINHPLPSTNIFTNFYKVPVISLKFSSTRMTFFTFSKQFVPLQSTLGPYYLLPYCISAWHFSPQFLSQHLSLPRLYASWLHGLISILLTTKCVVLDQCLAHNGHSVNIWVRIWWCFVLLVDHLKFHARIYLKFT